MNKKMRQEILKELKFLLKEVDISTNKGFFSQDQEEVLIKIQEANVDSENGISFINLTDFGKMVNERSLASLISSIKAADLSELDSTGLAAIKKLCSTKIVLVDEYGSVDPYFYVKCNNGKPFSAVRLGYEGKEDGFQDFIKRIENGVTPTPAPVTSGETGNFCSDSKNEGKPVPELINFICRGGVAVSTASASGSDAGQTTTGKGNIQCKDLTLIVIYQQWLKYVKKENVSVDGSYGPNTHAAAAKVLGEKQTFEQVKNDPNRICNFAAQKRAEWTTQIKQVAPNVRVGQVGTGGGGSGKKPAPATPPAPPAPATPPVPPAAPVPSLPAPATPSDRTVVCNDGRPAPGNDINKCTVVAEGVAHNAGSTLEEKKIREAGVLFNKLIKRL